MTDPPLPIQLPVEYHNLPWSRVSLHGLWLSTFSLLLLLTSSAGWFSRMGKSSRAPPSTSPVPYSEDTPDTTSAQRRGRDVLGCLTCRVRRKKCPDSKGDDSIPCSACVRNAVDCLGYPGPSPPWAGRMQVCSDFGVNSRLDATLTPFPICSSAAPS